MVASSHFHTTCLLRASLDDAPPSTFSRVFLSLIYDTTAKPQSLFNDTARIVQLVYSIDAKKA